MAYRSDFGDAVRRAVNGRPYRVLAAKTQMVSGEEISPAYIADMIQGRIPSREKLDAFILGCEVEPAAAAELLALAGYGATLVYGVEAVEGMAFRGEITPEDLRAIAGREEARRRTRE